MEGHSCLCIRAHSIVLCNSPDRGKRARALYNALCYRPRSASLAGFNQLWSIPSWDRWFAGPKVPPGNLLNEVLVDFDGTPRTAENNAPGAFVRASK